MITFADGPVQGKTLILRRAPQLLRVVVDSSGSVDALDQLDDAPKPDESITVYRLDQASLCRYHVMTRGYGKDGARNGWYMSAVYRLASDQPDDVTVRNRAAWQEWALAHSEPDAEDHHE